MFNTAENGLNISVLNPVIQSNTLDCGVYAISNAVKFAFNRLSDLIQNGKNTWLYNEEKMKMHLINFLEKKVSKPFSIINEQKYYCKLNLPSIQ